MTTPYWASALAEELAEAFEKHDWPRFSWRVTEVARQQGVKPWIVAQLVARECDRLGIRRVGSQWGRLRT